jgi:hypothetical protein
MQSILVKFLRAHHQHEAWWSKFKITPKASSHPTQDALLLLDESLGEYGLSKLLGISMQDLWEVLIECKKKGKRGNIIGKKGIAQFITNNELTKGRLQKNTSISQASHIRQSILLWTPTGGDSSAFRIVIACGCQNQT